VLPPDDLATGPKRSRSASGAAARSAFTLFEVVAAALIVSIIAAVTVPVVLDALDRKRVSDTYTLLQELQIGVANTQGTGFMNTVRTGAAVTTSSTVPGLLSELSAQIATTDLNSCAATFNNTTATNSWPTNGPYIDRVVGTQGIASPIGQIQNTLVRTVNPPTTPAFLQIRINNVDPNDADKLDLLVDGVANTAQGTIRYTTASGVSTVNYLIPVVNRC
jgi:type II secretory pathway pseudopilin PulG